MLLLSVTQVGYVLITLKSTGYLFSNIIGVVIVLSGCVFYKKLKKEWAKLGIMMAFMILGYPLFGFYGLFTVFLCLLREGLSLFSDKRNRVFSIVTIVVGILLIVFIITMKTTSSGRGFSLQFGDASLIICYVLVFCSIFLEKSNTVIFQIR